MSVLPRRRDRTVNNRTLFLCSKGVSHIGTKLFTFALSWYILSETGSGLNFSISLLVNYLPQIILSLFAGNLSDRTLRPNRILVLCDAVSAGQSSKAGWESGKAALRCMFGQEKLRTFFIADSLGNFCFSGGVNVALPLIAVKTLGISSSGYGLISSSVAAGSVLCAIWRTKFPCDSRLRYPYLKLGMIGGCMLVLALVARLPRYAFWTVAILCLTMFAVGWLSVDINIQTKTTIQLFVDPRHLGKVPGMSTSMSFILIPLSLVIAGGVSEIWPPFVLPLSNGIILTAALGLLYQIECGAARRL